MINRDGDQATLGRSQIRRIAYEAMYDVLVLNSGVLGDNWFRDFSRIFALRINSLAEVLVSSTSLPDLNYPFQVFQRGSTNIGLRLIYRQEWKPLSAQPGEIVRTIPLGPGEL